MNKEGGRIWDKLHMQDKAVAVQWGLVTGTNGLVDSPSSGPSSGQAAPSCTKLHQAAPQAADASHPPPAPVTGPAQTPAPAPATDVSSCR